jgi:hypothetical protein
MAVTADRQTPELAFGIIKSGDALPAVLVARPGKGSRRMEPRDHGMEYKRIFTLMPD